MVRNMEMPVCSCVYFFHIILQNWKINIKEKYLSPKRRVTINPLLPNLKIGYFWKEVCFSRKQKKKKRFQLSNCKLYNLVEHHFYLVFWRSKLFSIISKLCIGFYKSMIRNKHLFLQNIGSKLLFSNFSPTPAL